MEKKKEFKNLGVGEKLKFTESLGAKVATIMNKARAKCNKILQPTGYGVNIKIDFYRIEDTPQEELKIQEVENG